MANLTPEQAKQMLLAITEIIIENEPMLSEADRLLGDGDHGIGMKRGFSAAAEELNAIETMDSLSQPFKVAGMAMMSTMGGASGAVFGSMYQGAAKGLKAYEELSSEAVAVWLTDGLAKVVQVGGAKAGDKTMCDALIPAAEKAQEVKDLPLAEAIVLVAQAAEDGKEASKDMLATMGRAKSLGEKSIGYPDPGACSVTLMLQAARDYITSL